MTEKALRAGWERRKAFPMGWDIQRILKVFQNSGEMTGGGAEFLPQSFGALSLVPTHCGLRTHFFLKILAGHWSRFLFFFPRHEYFRRILCNLFGTEIENGEMPNDIELVGSIIKDICFNNAQEYFGWEVGHLAKNEKMAMSNGASL